jgi:hypothetical protein
MHSVRDVVDLVFGEHHLRDLGMSLGHAIDEVTEVECEEGHVEPVLAAEDILHLEHLVTPQHAPDEFQWELIMTGGHRRVCSEDTLRSEGCNRLCSYEKLPSNQGFRNQQVIGSSPIAGSLRDKDLRDISGRGWISVG